MFVDRVDRDHRQSDAEFKRRRIVVAATLVVGATLLGLSFSTEPGEPAFYPLTIGLAATWALGSLISGPLHLGHIEFRGVLRRPILAPIAVGLLLAAVFVVGALVFREVPFLTGLTEDVIGYARYGILPVVVIITIMNGIAEELFFRGALFAGIGVRHPVTISTLLYTLATLRVRQPGARLRRRPARHGGRSGATSQRRGAGSNPDPRHLVDGNALPAAVDLPGLRSDAVH